MKTEPPLDTRCRDKFLVQSVPITSDKEFSNLTAIVSRHMRGEIKRCRLTDGM